MDEIRNRSERLTYSRRDTVIHRLKNIVIVESRFIDKLFAVCTNTQVMLFTLTLWWQKKAWYVSRSRKEIRITVVYKSATTSNLLIYSPNVPLIAEPEAWLIKTYQSLLHKMSKKKEEVLTEIVNWSSSNGNVTHGFQLGCIRKQRRPAFIESFFDSIVSDHNDLEHRKDSATMPIKAKSLVHLALYLEKVVFLSSFRSLTRSAYDEIC